MESNDKAECRWCKRKLHQYDSVSAIVWSTKIRARVNHYGGFVCSKKCDEMATKEMHAGVYIQPWIQEEIDKNWTDGK